MSVILSPGPELLVGPAAVFLIGVWLATCRRPRNGLAVVVGVTAGLQTAQVGSLHIFCIAVLVWALFGTLRERRSPASPRVGVLVVGCAALLASTALTGPLVNSPLLAAQLLLLAVSAALIATLGDEEDVRYLLLGLLITTTIASTMGVLQYVGVLPYEVYLGTDRPIGLYSEPDWLGTFSAVGLVIAFYRRPGAVRTSLTVVHLAALLLAAARAAWLAVIVVLVVGYLAARFLPKERQPSGGWRLVLLAAAAGAMMLVLSPPLQEYLVERVDGAVGDETDVSAAARRQQIIGLLRLAEQAPWNGQGLSASGRVGVSGRITYLGEADNNVASNWVIGWLVDGGLLAVPIIALFVVAAVCRTTGPTGLLLTVVLLSSLFSNAMLIPIAWLSLGVCLVHVPGRSGRPPSAAAVVGPPLTSSWTERGSSRLADATNRLVTG